MLQGIIYMVRSAEWAYALACLLALSGMGLMALAVISVHTGPPLGGAQGLARLGVLPTQICLWQADLQNGTAPSQSEPMF